MRANRILYILMCIMAAGLGSCSLQRIPDPDITPQEETGWETGYVILGRTMLRPKITYRKDTRLPKSASRGQ